MANSTSASAAATTAPPDPDLVAQRLDFWARQATSTTCGYINGNISSPVTCAEELSCLSFTSQNVHLCNLPLLAFPATTCMDSTAYVTACNTDCQNDFSTTKCISSTNTYCVTMYWNSPINGTNPPMSEFTCAPAPATYSVISAADVEDALSTGTSTASTTVSNSNGASTTSSTSTSSTGGTRSSSSSGLSHTDIIIIVVSIFGFLFVVTLVSAAIKRWRRTSYKTHPIYVDNGNNGNNGYTAQYPLTDTTSHVSPSTWGNSYTPTTVSGIPEARSEVVPDDSVSQVNVPQPSRYSNYYSHAPTGSVGL